MIRPFSPAQSCLRDEVSEKSDLSLRDISGRRLLEQFLVRMNTGSEKVLRRRSARGPTLPYDLRFRRSTIHCVTKFGSLLGLHALKPPLPGVETCSVTFTNRLFDASNRDILFNLARYKGDDEQSAQDCRIMFSK